jgi:hypothetical protein
VRHNKKDFENKTRMETQIKFYKVMAVSAVPYSSENWAFISTDTNRIQAIK